MTTSTTMSPTIRVDKAGGPEEMKLVELPVGEPGPKEVRIRHHAIGLNFLDVYQRSGVYPLPLPLSLGNEAAGVIEAVGAEVTHLKPGDRARLLRRAAGRPTRWRASWRRRHVVPAARRDLVRDRRGDDAEGDDDPVPVQAHAGRRRTWCRATSSSSMRPPAASA